MAAAMGRSCVADTLLNDRTDIIGPEINLDGGACVKVAVARRANVFELPRTVNPCLDEKTGLECPKTRMPENKSA